MSRNCLIFPYVAVVSDNDGSAFITKAEFDSLKNNFQAQIDNYNQSIDSKIDGAIASYLAGIKVSTDDTPEYSVYGSPYSTSPHKWDGRVANVVYMVSVARYGWYIGEDGTTGLKYWFNLTSSVRSNPKGYGYGYWVQGYKSGAGKYFGGAENKGFILMQKNIYLVVANMLVLSTLDSNTVLTRQEILIGAGTLVLACQVLIGKRMYVVKS